MRASASHEGEEAGLSIPQDHQSANDILSGVALFCMQHVGQFSVIRYLLTLFGIRQSQSSLPSFGCSLSSR